MDYFRYEICNIAEIEQKIIENEKRRFITEKKGIDINN